MLDLRGQQAAIVLEQALKTFNLKVAPLLPALENCL